MFFGFFIRQIAVCSIFLRFCVGGVFYYRLFFRCILFCCFVFVVICCSKYKFFKFCWFFIIFCITVSAAYSPVLITVFSIFSSVWTEASFVAFSACSFFSATVFFIKSAFKRLLNRFTSFSFISNIFLFFVFISFYKIRWITNWIHIKIRQRHIQPYYFRVFW